LPLILTFSPAAKIAAKAKEKDGAVQKTDRTLLPMSLTKKSLCRDFRF
jgi:hypothetical protein